MKVHVDDVWASPSNLHVRVTVSDDNGVWRHRYYNAIPLSEVPEEALAMAFAYLMDGTPEEDHHQTALF